MRRSARDIRLTASACLIALLGGCTGDHFQPRLPSAPPSEVRSFPRQLELNRNLPLARYRNVSIAVMLPRYGTVEQIRRGNMGHAAIDVDGRLYDIGALNGYAYTLHGAPAVRFWNFNDMDAALDAVRGHPDADGHLDRLVRFDITVTDAQAEQLHSWWAQLQARIDANPHNRLYLWCDWQCASAVSRSLRDAGVTQRVVQSPSDLGKYLTRRLRHTAGPYAGELAARTVVQSGRRPPSEPAALWQFATIVFHFPGLFTAGRRTSLKLRDPDGHVEPLLWSESPAYLNQVRRFQQEPRAAVERAVAVGARGAQILPDFVVGDWYHIATDHVIGQAALGGWYVNGNTGEVMRIDDARVIQFDAFGRDRVILPGN